VVLLLITVTLALSYSIMRAQAMATAIQQNANLTAAARQAAMTGIAAGIKTMHNSAWAGVDTMLARSLGATERFEVTFTTGDPTLTAEDSQYADYPYRVTLVSTGYASAPGDPNRVASHCIRAVVRLIPRALASEPSDFNNVVQHTLYQSTTGGDFRVSVPFRMQGSVRVQGELELAKMGWGWLTGWTRDVRSRYLVDLNGMRQAGYGDFRPFDGTICLPYAQQDGTLVNLLTSMEIPNADTAARSLSGWSQPGDMGTYRVYPGGKAYTVPPLAQNQSNVTWQPDPKTNPLGIFYRNGSLNLYDNVRIQGTVVTKASSDGDVLVRGRNVHLEPLDLPPLQGSTAPVQLPVVMSGSDLRVYAGAEASLAGFLAVADDFEMVEDWQHLPLRLTVQAAEVGSTLDAFVYGRLCSYSDLYSLSEARRMILAACVKVDGQTAQPSAPVAAGQQVTVYPRFLLGKILFKDFHFNERWEWAWCLDWQDKYNDFRAQDAQPDGVRWFPQWLALHSDLRPEPQFGVRPDPNAPRYHWKNRQDPVYVPHPDDEGLCWELLKWTDIRVNDSVNEEESRI
jgi:hypothetical protein